MSEMSKNQIIDDNDDVDIHHHHYCKCHSIIDNNNRLQNNQDSYSSINTSLIYYSSKINSYSYRSVILINVKNIGRNIQCLIQIIGK
ncbi:hypothetical protein DERP_003098 [Dermatophagoides pteronyssinus]|uniref:Uncharacterized protein n=1 Tax=Dermatophagoides pteronyssinus TaxID=6956 RepID=A0ABQ8JII2_DERPT|nr:hypothetical protein DERP_003098 [Dermatophagoides pteronyssinus]